MGGVFVEFGSELKDSFLESGVPLSGEFEKFGEITKDEIGSEVMREDDGQVSRNGEIFENDAGRRRVVKVN